jgi:hypothetical protein
MQIIYANLIYLHLRIRTSRPCIDFRAGREALSLFLPSSRARVTRSDTRRAIRYLARPSFIAYYIIVVKRFIA